MNILKRLAAAATLVPFLVLGVISFVPSTAGAVACDPKDVSVTGGANCASSNDQKTNIGVVIKDVTNVLLFIIGAVAVIMIILGGIRYTTSNGDSNQVTAAKNTILYGVIGVVVALLAFAIVNFVVAAFSSSGGDTPGGGAGAAR